jgi:hypothetical protein
MFAIFAVAMCSPFYALDKLMNGTCGKFRKCDQKNESNEEAVKYCRKKLDYVQINERSILATFVLPVSAMAI